MALDQRGDISIVEIIIYIPVLIVGAILVMRHGFSRKAGWVFLVILAIMRIVGGVTHVLSETSDKNSTSLIITYSICEMAGTSPLLLASLGFLSAAATGALDDHILMTRGTRLAGLVGTVAIILSIVGGVKTGDASTESDITEGLKLRRAGACLYVVLYAFLAFFAFNVWAESARLSSGKRRLLTGASMALPFIAIRVVYTVLSAFAPAAEVVIDGHVMFTHTTGGLSTFSATSGSWVAFLIMSLLMEYAAVVIFGVTGLGIRGDDEVSEAKSWGSA